MLARNLLTCLLIAGKAVAMPGLMALSENNRLSKKQPLLTAWEMREEIWREEFIGMGP